MTKIASVRRRKLKKRLKLKYYNKVKYFEFQDKAFRVFAIFCTLFGITILGALLVHVFSAGLGRIDWDFMIDGPSRRASTSGIYTAWIGTMWMLVLTACISFPIGVGAAVYLEEYSKKNRLSNFLEINIANLAGVPSIIYGLLGLELFSRVLHLGKSLMTGSLTLSLLILPVIIVSTREALRAVPYTIREGSYALGASKWQTIWFQVLPASISGIFTGVILALSRAVGETAPLIVIGALTYIRLPPTDVMSAFTVLPIQIFDWISRPQADFKVNAAAAIIVLLAITFLMNGIAVYLRYRWQKKVKW